MAYLIGFIRISFEKTCSLDLICQEFLDFYL